jgi:hypothetical protein
MEKKTLKEVAEKLASTTEEFNMFIAGAKWQQEQMYSEDELIDFAEYIRNNQYVWNYPDKIQDKRTTKELFKQFKKK